MPLKGDFSGLERAGDRVKGLGNVPRKMKTIARSRLKRVVAKEFRSGTDPYGSAWAPLSPSTRSKSGVPLKGRGVMRRGLTVRTEGSKIILTIPSPAQWLQMGRANMPARQIFPARANGLPPAYVEALRQAATVAAGGMKPRST